MYNVQVRRKNDKNGSAHAAPSDMLPTTILLIARIHSESNISSNLFSEQCPQHFWLPWTCNWRRVWSHLSQTGGLGMRRRKWPESQRNCSHLHGGHWRIIFLQKTVAGTRPQKKNRIQNISEYNRDRETTWDNSRTKIIKDHLTQILRW